MHFEAVLSANQTGNFLEYPLLYLRLFLNLLCATVSCEALCASSITKIVNALILTSSSPLNNHNKKFDISSTNDGSVHDKTETAN